MTVWTPFRYRGFPFDPWNSLSRAQGEIGRLLEEAWSEVSAGYPPLNVCYDENEAVITAELPGVAQEEIEVEVVGNSLTLKGERKLPVFGEKERLVRQEREFGTFSRSVRLPFEVEHNRIEAALSNGILKLTLPRKAAEVPKKITIACH